MGCRLSVSIWIVVEISTIIAIPEEQPDTLTTGY